MAKDTVKRKVIGAAFAYVDHDAERAPGTPPPTRVLTHGTVADIPVEAVKADEEMGISVLGPPDADVAPMSAPPTPPADTTLTAADLAEMSVDEVNDYLEANPEQRDAVIALERDGKNRKGITGE